MRTAHYTFSISFIALGAFILAGSPGCKKAPPPPPVAKGSGSASGGQSTGQPTGAPGQRGISGEIIETMNAAGYTYLKLRTAKGEVWAAVRKAKVTKGQKVTVIGGQPMKDFKSRSLKRTFAVIYFGRLGGAGHGASKGNPHAGRSRAGAMGSKGHPKRSGGKRATFDKPLVKAPGTNGRTVAEVYAQRKELNGKPVVIRGKVVKFSKNIMGKNWIHLQDGSGKTDDFDLTVTSQATAKVGDLVLVEGTVKADVNVGAGYSYKVLLEKATLKPGK